MQYITTTQLRTKSSDLINALLSGDVVRLIHRSQPVGLIQSLKKSPFRQLNIKSLLSAIKEMNRPSLKDKQIDKLYRTAMLRKHGKHISRH